MGKDGTQVREKLGFIGLVIFVRIFVIKEKPYIGAQSYSNEPQKEW